MQFIFGVDFLGKEEPSESGDLVEVVCEDVVFGGVYGPVDDVLPEPEDLAVANEELLNENSTLLSN